MRLYECLLPSRLLKVQERDFNLDTNPEFISINLCVPVTADESITSVRLMTFFAVNLTQLVVEDLSAMVFVQYDSPVAGGEFRVCSIFLL